MTEKKLLPVGTRIRFLRDIFEDANGDHPTFTLSKKGEQGTVTKHGQYWDHYVTWDKWTSAAFGAEYGVDFMECD